MRDYAIVTGVAEKPVAAKEPAKLITITENKNGFVIRRGTEESVFESAGDARAHLDRLMNVTPEPIKGRIITNPDGMVEGKA